MVDLYTKSILTVIALALVGLLFRPWLEPTPARAQNGCGDMGSPCWTYSFVYNKQAFLPKPTISAEPLAVKVQ